MGDSGHLDRLASQQRRLDNLPNREVARVLVDTLDRSGVAVIASNLRNESRYIRSDCIKVLYEVGYLRPEMIAPFVEEFLELLKDQDNRMVWGGMIALGLIAELRAQEIYFHLPLIKEIMGKGSVITVDNGVKVLAAVAGSSPEFERDIFPLLLDHLASCRQKELPQHAEKMLVAVNQGNSDQFVAIIEKRMKDTTEAQKRRLRIVVTSAKTLANARKG